MSTRLDTELKIRACSMLFSYRLNETEETLTVRVDLGVPCYELSECDPELRVDETAIVSRDDGIIFSTALRGRDRARTRRGGCRRCCGRSRGGGCRSSARG